MEQLRDDLWLTALDVNEGVNSCGFLLKRERGNVLFYKAPSEASFAEIEALGGVDLYVLSHRHEVDPGTRRVKDVFGARLCADPAEAEAIAEHCPVDCVIEPGARELGDIEVISTPGHTVGGVSCVYRNPKGDVYLFSGDTMIPVAGQWVAQTVAAHGGDGPTLVKSLRRLRDVLPSLVLSSASVGENTAIEVGREQWLAAVDTTAGRDPIVA